ncbi:LysR family transcriptional regulator [Amycolatopsis endophytica]|uniref:DNA-binding transcriptional LysR family regulator n=1 Tax=Amycolatopsis endophytica TaxID=860233 RepID=A0A853B1N7_9PSEU|nr:LysR family transcriptional regulator [Amycolatopsis endophytica]NYI88879.1 DNA-binding transcriptional LysR family regulator [Amycolatopsis endophytica]
MNLEAVRAFVAVTERGQFRYAADELGISQQAVSKRIAALERDLGVTLLHRRPTGATTTLRGAAFLPQAREVLRVVQRAVDSVRRTDEPLRVGVLSHDLAPAGLLRRFRRRFPDLAVETRVLGGARPVLAALDDGGVDAVFCRVTGTAQGIEHRAVHLEPLQVVVGHRHPLAAKGRVHPRELQPYPARVAGADWASFCGQFARDFALHLDIAGAGELLDTIAASRTLITFAGAGTRLPERPVRRVPLAEPAPRYPWSLAWRTGAGHPDLPTLVAHLPPAAGK